MFDFIIQYFNKRFELIKLDVKESTSEILGIGLFVFILLLISVFFIGMLNISIALLLGDCFSNLALGFGVLVLFYILLFFLFYRNRKKIINFFVNKVVEILNKKQ